MDIDIEIGSVTQLSQRTFSVIVQLYRLIVYSTNSHSHSAGIKWRIVFMLISSELGFNKCPILCVVFSTDHAWLLYYFCKMRDGKSCYFLPLAPPSTCPHRCCVSGVCSPQSVQIYCKMCASPRTNTEPPALGQILPGWRLSVDVLRAVACLAPAWPPATSHGPWNRRRMLPSETGKEGDSVPGYEIFDMVWWPQKIS